MLNSCISEAISLGKPENYTFLMHIMTCFEVPVNLFGAYCILFKTPKRMASVKGPMLILHCLCSFEDFFLSFLSIPYTFYPKIAFFALGVWDSAEAMAFIVVNFLGAVGASTVAIFENRYFLLFGKETIWRKFRKIMIFINYTQTPVLMITVYLSVPEQAEALAIVQKTMPCLITDKINEVKKVFVMCLDGTFFLTGIALITSVFTLEITCFILILITKMLDPDRKKSMTSKSSNDLQRKFLMALGLQTLIPIIVLVFPISYIVISAFINYYNQTMNNLIMCFFAFHGLLSTVIMVLVHSPYRKVTLWPIYRLIRGNSRELIKVSVINQSVVQ